MILIVSTCKEDLHMLEFVRPIMDIIGKDCIVRRYDELINEDIDNCDKIIIAGTSLQDNDVLRFDLEFIRTTRKPILGICAGMQCIGRAFNLSLYENPEIGFYDENFDEEFLGLKGKQNVYHLHNYSVDFNNSEFIEYVKGQAVKHNRKEIFGVLFHPEVRQKEMIKKFIGL